MANKKTIVKWCFNILWIGIAAATIVLLVAAIRIKDAQPCKEIEVSIAAPGENYFVDKKDVLAVISSVSGGNPLSRSAGSFKLQQMESELKKNVWIKDAQLFFDNNEVLHINITERTPVVRVFSTGGTTFYLDSSAAKLPLSDKFSARLPVFTGFPSDKVILSAADSNLLKSIRVLGMAIAKDSFCMAMIEQVDIQPDGNFEMLLKIGNSIVLFGNESDAAAKLDRLKLFYRQVIPKAGWNYYRSINVQYSNQVVAARRGAADVTADSLRTVQLLQLLAVEAERRSSDSLQNFVPDSPGNSADSSIIQQSIQRDDAVDAGGAAVDLPKPAVQQPVGGAVNNAAATAPVVPKPVAAPKPAAPKPVPKPVVNKPAVPKPKPKPKPPAARPRAVMPPRNEY
jgi:cell division protein FtsQ